MISTTELQNCVKNYRERCRTENRTPTYTGLSLIIGTSPQTVANVVHGTFNGGHEYTATPHPNRCIDNTDFDLIKGLYEQENANPGTQILNTKKGGI